MAREGAILKRDSNALTKRSYRAHPLYRRHLNTVRALIYRKTADLQVEMAITPEPVAYADRLGLQYRPMRAGERWGKMFDCGWARVRGNVGAAVAADPSAYVAVLDIGGEGCVFDDRGVVQGLTNVLGDVDRLQSIAGKRIVRCDKLQVRADGELEIWVEIGNNGQYGFDIGAMRFNGAWVGAEDREALEYYYDFMALAQFADVTRDETRRKRVRDVLAAAMRAAGSRPSRDDIVRARGILAAEYRDNPSDFTVYAVGHAHLDLAWLWPIRETKRKAERTFSNALAQIERYPDYIFGASQPQQFLWMQQRRPELYARIKQAIADGSIEPQGGMWVEPDTNLPCGESLIRQCLYGKRFFEREFGIEPDILWVPDVFGYTGALPQIMRGCGMDRFMTIKLSWNTVNRFPYQSFVWHGIDGTAVLVHMPPEGDYNSNANPASLDILMRRYSERDRTDCALMPFGIGDGGAGAGEYHIQMARRCGKIEGMPNVRMSNAKAFFDRLQTQIDRLPVHSGELYLEKHRGTYTTQAKVKRFNRLMERALHDTEWLCALAHRRGMAYPHDALDELWQETLLYQFHDVLPGSSIRRVYEECYARYPQMLERAEALSRQALEYLRGDGQQLCAINSAPVGVRGYLADGDRVWRYDAPAYGAAQLQALSVEQTATGLGYTADGIYNDKLAVRFDRYGDIVSLVDKTHGDYDCVATAFNALRIYDDRRMRPYNAWDIDPKYVRRPNRRLRLVGSNTYTDGARVVREHVYRYGKSTLRQTISLERDADCVVFDTVVDWHETHKMLRVDFYPKQFGDTVKCDIQFGHIDRSARNETSLEKAQFEIVAHKWVDVYGQDYGVAVLNDCKYGHRVKDGKISLNLLRSTVYPDPTADRGEQTFRYAVYPHAAQAMDSDLIARGYALNRPVRLEKGVQIPSMRVESDSVLLESVFVNRDGDTVLRLYESKGRQASASVDTDGRIAFETDMLCRNAKPIDAADLRFRPFEIKTLVLKDGE